MRDIAANKGLLDIEPYEPGRPIDEVKRSLGIKDVVKLASNENPIGPSKKALSAIRRSLPTLNRYPDGGCFYLKKRLAGKLGVDRDNLIFGNGSDELIVFAARAFLASGDEVIISEPSFLIYRIASTIRSAKINSVPRAGGFQYNIAALREAVSDKTKMLFLANPDNPTGVYISKEGLEELLDALPDRVLVFLDEAYFELADKRDYPNGIDYINNYNVIVTRTFSKAYGLAGLRIGYGIARPEIIKIMDRVREPFNVNSAAQGAAAAALDDSAHFNKTRRILKEGKTYLYKELDGLGLQYIESQTNFILIDVKKDSKAVFDALLKKGVIIRDMRPWRLDNFIRVTVGLPEENRKFIKALKDVFKK